MQDNKNLSLIESGHIEYNLDYKHDNDDSRVQYFYSKLPIHSGEIIQPPEDSFYYYVISVYHDQDGANLWLSKSSQNIQEAFNVPYDLKDLPFGDQSPEY